MTVRIHGESSSEKVRRLNGYKHRDVDDTEHGSLDDIMRKKLRRLQENERTKVNKYSEGFCYGCGRKDEVWPIITTVCFNCMGKRSEIFTGKWFKDSSLLGIGPQLIHLHCSFCGKFVKNSDVGRRKAGAQLNYRICDKCWRHQGKIEFDYSYVNPSMPRRYRHPMYYKLRKQKGKDWKYLLREDSVRR